MPELTEQDLIAIRETHDKVIRIDAVLGDGQTGLCFEVRSHNKRLQRVEWIVVAIISSGTLGGGIIATINWLGG